MVHGPGHPSCPAIRSATSENSCAHSSLTLSLSRGSLIASRPFPGGRSDLCGVRGVEPNGRTMTRRARPETSRGSAIRQPIPKSSGSATTSQRSGEDGADDQRNAASLGLCRPPLAEPTPHHPSGRARPSRRDLDPRARPRRLTRVPRQPHRAKRSIARAKRSPSRAPSSAGRAQALLIAHPLAPPATLFVSGVPRQPVNQTSRPPTSITCE